MSYTNQTQYYGLPDFSQDDKPSWLNDFNNAMATIDNALHGLQEQINSLNPSVSPINVVQNTGTSLTDVMSQNAVSELIDEIQTSLTNQGSSISQLNTKTTTLQSSVNAASNQASEALSASNGNTTAINDLTTTVNNKQDTLVSGTTIKTVNGQSLLGAGNIQISSGSGNNNVYVASATNVRLSTTGVNILNTSTLPAGDYKVHIELEGTHLTSTQAPIAVHAQTAIGGNNFDFGAKNFNSLAKFSTESHGYEQNVTIQSGNSVIIALTASADYSLASAVVTFTPITPINLN